MQTESKRKTTSRRSIHKGGPSASVHDLRDRIKVQDDSKKTEDLQKAKRKLSQAVNKAKSVLKVEGIQARKDEKARLQRLKDYEA
jgi:hypothetical protein